MEGGDRMDAAEVTDQVKRLWAFDEAHPEVEVTHFRDPVWHYRAVWYDQGLRREITAPELRELLDTLESQLDT